MFGPGWGNTWSGGWAGTTTAWGAPGLVDSEALIAVELCIIKGNNSSEDLRIANILFNNLDIIGKCQYPMQENRCVSSILNLFDVTLFRINTILCEFNKNENM